MKLRREQRWLSMSKEERDEVERRQKEQRSEDERQERIRELRRFHNQFGVVGCRNLMEYSPEGLNIDSVKSWEKTLQNKCKLGGRIIQHRLNLNRKGFWFSSGGKNEGSGYGKTSFSMALVADYQTRNPYKKCKIVNWKDLCLVWDGQYNGNDGTHTSNEALRQVQNCDILLIDEIQNNLTEAKQEFLFSIIDRRIHTPKVTIFTSNVRLGKFLGWITNHGLRRRLSEEVLGFEVYVDDKTTSVFDVKNITPQKEDSDNQPHKDEFMGW